ncbi:MAG: hypothetical protein KF760_01675 [Candidatus Eremiobacteraeota bacterium]|nr:hypothetical protein [Candidatus Eremiobacteraeota bacterium]MCW5872735.1 hypothetical protein [Candidatus Eremiobacteraeota bacterium]
MKRIFAVLLLLAPLVASASPLMTEEYPLWVQDAVRSLRQNGLVSAGCLPDQALTRSDLAPLLDKVFDLQEKQEAQMAPKSDLAEIRTLMESLMEQTARLNGRVETDNARVEKQLGP